MAPRAGVRAGARSRRVRPWNLRGTPGSFAPDRNSSSRNCTDWKPLAGASFERNTRKSWGVMVSSTASCATSTFSIASTRRSRWRAHRSRPSLIASRAVIELVQHELEPQLVDLVDRDEEQLVVRRRVGLEALLVEQLGDPQVAAVREPGALLAEASVRGRRLARVGHDRHGSAWRRPRRMETAPACGDGPGAWRRPRRRSTEAVPSDVGARFAGQSVQLTARRSPSSRRRRSGRQAPCRS